MKKRILIFISACLSAVVGYSQRMLDVSTGTFSSTMEPPKVERSITPIENGYNVKYFFSKAALVPDNIFTDCEIWHLDGFSANITPEEPAYPYASDSFSIPQGQSATINVIEEKWTTIECTTSPSRPPLPMSDSIGYSVKNILPIKITDSWVPAQTISDNGTRTYKGTNIINIGIAPVQFNTAQGIARICKTLEYEITFTPNLTKAIPYNSNNGIESSKPIGDPYLETTTLNWNWENQKTKAQYIHDDINYNSTLGSSGLLYPKNRISTPTYLILAPYEYKYTVEQFANWKRTIGFNAITAYKDIWNHDDITDEILSHEKISYLLLIGNNSQICGEELSASPNGDDRTIISDLPYVCHDGTDFISDISYGRLPVNNLAEANLVLSRIIEYERNPYKGTSFYNSNLFISKFLGNDSTSTIRNSQTTYDISQYLKQRGHNVCNLFTAAPIQTPLYWGDYGQDDDNNIVNPVPIPFEMRKPQYTWNVTTSELLSEINKGYSQIFYFAHGGIREWSDPKLTVTDLSNLTNGRKLPVVFSFACQTGNYAFKESFANRFLTAPQGGAIGLFGFTDNTFSIYTDVMAYAIYNCLYPNPGINPLISNHRDKFSISLHPKKHRITELGLLHKLAITEIYNAIPNNPNSFEFKKYEAGMFTLFGDPSMHILLSKPEPVSFSLTKSISGEYTLIVPDSLHTITVYYGSSNRVLNYKNSLKFSSTGTPSQFCICVHAPGMIPKIVNLSDSPAKVASNNQSNVMVKEGTIWRYNSYFNNNMDPSENIDVDLCFHGTTEIDGREYLACYVWKSEDNFEEDKSAIVAYMREEDGKVYARYIPDAHKTAMQKGIDLIPYSPMMSIVNHDLTELSEHDVLLFDPTLEIGDDLICDGDSKKNSEWFEVVGIEEIECLGKTYNYYHFKNGSGTYNFCEGIGSFTGLLPMPDPVPETYGVDPWILKEVIDDKGNVIFETSKIGAGVDNIHEITDTLEPNAVETVYYDLTGRRIDNPAKGSIVICHTRYADGTIKTSKKVF